MPLDFPQSTEITVFDDPPNESPLSQGGKWFQARGDRDPMRVVGTDATDTTHDGANYSYYGETPLGTSPNPVEVWCCTTGGQLGAALETWRVFLMFGPASPGGLLPGNGYLMWFGGGLAKSLVLNRYDAWNFGPNVEGGLPGSAYPEKIGMRITNGTVEGWVQITGVWSQILTLTDSTYRGTFYGGIGVEDPTGGGLAIPCFGGALVLWLPSFLRRQGG